MQKEKKIDNFASLVLVTQISGSAALDAIIDDSDCRGPLRDLIAGQDCQWLVLIASMLVLQPVFAQ